MTVAKKVIVIGLDGLEPSIVDGMLNAGELPNLARLRETGGYDRIATTSPAQTPVAWSTFATGVNPGGHGIFDFLRRDPATYLPDLALNRFEQSGPFLPPRVVNLRRGTPIWEVLSDAGVASTVIRCPCSFPPDELRGRMLSGMGVPDIRGGLGTSTFYTTDTGVQRGEGEQVVVLEGSGRTFRTRLIGPRNTRQRADFAAPLTVDVDVARRRCVIGSDGQPAQLDIAIGEWSGWLRVRFKTGLLASTSGMVRFLLVGTDPHVELYASPVNFDPASPMFPISHPPSYAGELSRKLGPFYTTGMVEDHTGLTNERFDEAAFLAQCDDALEERNRMMQLELARTTEGFLFCLFDTPDRLQHMFWRFREADHPANARYASHRHEFGRVIEGHYARCDAIVGEVLAAVDHRTLCVVLSDHGFGSFQRGVHLNAWLRDEGLLTLKAGIEPGEEAGEFFRHVDWGHTSAYALGLGSIYLNVKGREGEGIVAPEDVDEISDHIARRVTGLVDPLRGQVAVRGARTRGQLYSGDYAAESPDVVVEFSAGYRVSWATALGGVPVPTFEDNVKKWGGDHIVDPALVPGVLFMNRPFAGGRARLLDMAPTILTAFGIPVPATMEGQSVVV